MTTLSAVIFSMARTTKVASVAAIHLAESGDSAVAAAMAMLIVYASSCDRSCIRFRMAAEAGTGCAANSRSEQRGLLAYVVELCLRLNGAEATLTYKGYRRAPFRCHQ